MRSLDIDPLPPLRDVIAEHGLDARKSLGQNFLLDLNLTRRIARVGKPLDQKTVFEVGPGPGGLTRGLLQEGAAKVIVIERDRRCIPALEQISKAYPDRLHILEGDALKYSLQDIVPLAAPYSLSLTSNLPYNIGTQLFVNWVTAEKWPPVFDSLTLMFQREVADRIVAKPGTKAYGRLSILAQWRGNVSIALKIPRHAFTPPPKIESAVIYYQPRTPLSDRISMRDLSKLTEAAFSQRRKMLRSSLKGLHPDIGNIIISAGLDPEQRAETISVAGFVRLAEFIQDFR